MVTPSQWSRIKPFIGMLKGVRASTTAMFGPKPGWAEHWRQDLRAAGLDLNNQDSVFSFLLALCMCFEMALQSEFSGGVPMDSPGMIAAFGAEVLLAIEPYLPPDLRG
jgi:hypothetical protein